MTFPKLRILADENIPYVSNAFETLGEVKLIPGRSLNSSTVKDTDVLLVRSVTKVTRELLVDGPLQFVGTATAGLDHIDSDYLQTRGIALASAQGGNANSVAEYVVTALLILARRQETTLSGKTIGIIGAGNIGRQVKEKTEALGMTVVLNDPPLRQKTGDTIYRPLGEALDCDVVTVHVPLSCEGPFKTHHLFNDATFGHLKPSAIFINTSRGEIVDTHALLNQLRKSPPRVTVLDVWEAEPNLNWELLPLVSIGTPHIAGYSLDGKAEGTFLLYQALCQHLGITPSWRPSQSLPLPTLPRLENSIQGKTKEQFLEELATCIYKLEDDHRRMADLLNLPPDSRPFAFDQLRKDYPIRREFQNTTIQVLEGGTEWNRTIAGLGFKVGSERGR